MLPTLCATLLQKSVYSTLNKTSVPTLEGNQLADYFRHENRLQSLTPRCLIGAEERMNAVRDQCHKLVVGSIEAEDFSGGIADADRLQPQRIVD